MNSGTLYVVATPIGHLADISYRAVEILKTSDLIAAEDTRVSRVLANHYGIETPMTAYHDHNEATITPKLIAKLKAGATIALLSDAGTPLISDPGFRLVRAAANEQLTVSPIPGACAAVAALSVAGLPSDRFSFEGFLPQKASARRQRLERLLGSGANEPHASLVLYESCHRIELLLDDLKTLTDSNRQVVLARELTKKFETVLRGTAAELRQLLADDPNQRKGEFVVIVGPAPEREKPSGISPATEALFNALLEDLPASQAAKIAARISGESRKLIYQLKS